MALPRVDRVSEIVDADDAISQRQISNVGLGASYNWIGIRSIAPMLRYYYQLCKLVNYYAIDIVSRKH
jgi:hypothetical protein